MAKDYPSDESEDSSSSSSSSSFDESTEEDSDSSDSSDDESEQGKNGQQENPKTASVIKKRKYVIKKPEVAINKQHTPRKIVEFDDREETLQNLLQRLNNGDREIPPPDRIVSKIPNAIEFSRCIFKQLTESDVDGRRCRLVLGMKQVKDHILCHLEESEIPGVYIEGIDVSVFGSDGKSHEMKFKIWMRNPEIPVLIKGWNKFVKAYGLKKYSDVIKIWMFRSNQDRKICFAIDSTRFDITKRLSTRILKNVYKD